MLNQPSTFTSRYRLQAKLGEGGMGVVYRALDRLTGQIVALKRVTAPGDQLVFASKSTDQDIYLSLAQEFRTLAGLRHPHIVSVLDYGFDEHRQPYFTMQLIEDAQTLTEYAAALDLPGKLRLLTEMLQALTYLHQRNIIHRDLKPANVLVTLEGSVKVMDFGLAMNQTDSPSEMYAGAVGTLAYMAPELFTDEPATVGSDLYAVGIMAYEVFAGKYPFATKNMATLINSILYNNADTTMFDLPLARVLDRLLTKAIDERYPSADMVIEALCAATDQPLPAEHAALRESFLQAAKFVGRDVEQGRLIAALDGAIRGHGSAWLIGGESGVGKTRLLDELRTQALVAGAVVLRGQAVEGGGLPYQLWREPLRRLILGTAISDLEAGILKPLIADIDHLLERSIPDIPSLPGAAGQQRIALTIADLFKRQSQPLVLLLEDLQWSTESLLPLKHLHTAVSGLPVLVIGTYRDDETPKLPDEFPAIHLLKLARLSDAEVEELSISMLGEAGKQRELVALLQRETEGNTFFMVEVVRALAEDAGRLSQIKTMPLPEKVSTSGVETVIRRRLNRLPLTLHDWLKQAAVTGRELDLAVLTKASASLTLPDQDTLLTQCANAAVLEISDGQWRFTHDKLRETILTDLPPLERSQLHGQIATAIEQVYPDNDAYAQVLLEHWSAANDHAKTLHYTLPVAERLVIYTADYATAQRLLERGLQLTKELPDTTSTRARLFWLLAEAMLRQGDYDTARSYYQQSLELIAPDDLLAIDLWNGLSNIENRQGNYAAARDYGLQGLQLAEQTHNRRGMATSLNSLGVAADYQGDYAAARTYYEQSIALCRELGDQRGVGIGLNNLGNVISDRGDYAAARIYYEESLVIRRAIGDRLGIASSLNNLGIAAYDQGDYPASHIYHSQSLTIKREIGDRAGIAVSLSNLGVIAHHQGDYAAARSYDEQSMAIRQEIGDQYGVGHSLYNLGGTAHSMGDYAAARDYYEQSLAIRREINDQTGVAHSLINLGRTEITQDDIPAATRHLIEGLQLAREFALVPLQLELLVHFAHLHTLRAKPETAATWLGLAFSRPEIAAKVQEMLAQPVQAKLETILGSEFFTAAIEQGKMLDLATVLQQILAEYQSQDQTS